MTSGLLLNLALSEQQDIEIMANACKRVLYRQNECQICTDICPEQAITFELGPVINNNCTHCDLCISACPTEVFQNNIDMEQYLLDRFQDLANQSAINAQDNKTLNFHCQNAQASGEQSIATHCAGNISENLLLGGLLQGFSEIVINTGKCTECTLSKGIMLFNESSDRTRTLAQLVNVDDFSVQQVIQPKQNAKKRELSRRAFFSSISKQVKERTAPADYEKVNPLHFILGDQVAANNTNKKASQKRERLRKLLAGVEPKCNQDANQTVDYWQKMEVEQEKCVACAICVNVCPTGALEKTTKHDHLYRYYSSALCTNCGLCQEACPQNIIHFTTNYSLPDIIENKPELVARVELSKCQICGETIPTIEGSICTTCQKRQILPMFLSR